MVGSTRGRACHVAVRVDAAQDLIVAGEVDIYSGYASRRRVNVRPFALLEWNDALRERRVRQQKQDAKRGDAGQQALRFHDDSCLSVLTAPLICRPDPNDSW